MEKDPEVMCMMYILRKDLELGWEKANKICEMFFRSSTSRFTYGWTWKSFDVSGEEPFGLVFPRLSVNAHSDSIATNYLRQRCSVKVSLLPVRPEKSMFRSQHATKFDADLARRCVAIFQTVRARAGHQICQEHGQNFKVCQEASKRRSKSLLCAYFQCFLESKKPTTIQYYFQASLNFDFPRRLSILFCTWHPDSRIKSVAFSRFVFFKKNAKNSNFKAFEEIEVEPLRVSWYWWQSVS